MRQVENSSAQVIFSSILLIRETGRVRSRSIMQNQIGLHCWCHQEGFGFYDNGLYFNDCSLLGQGWGPFIWKGQENLWQQAGHFSQTSFKLRDWILLFTPSPITSSWVSSGNMGYMVGSKVKWELPEWQSSEDHSQQSRIQLEVFSQWHSPGINTGSSLI